jgi:putative phosphoesterase
VRCALISDVHSNRHALAAVLNDIHGTGVDAIFNAGDTFGYYPWAREVYELLQSSSLYSVLGNHDCLILDPLRPLEPPSYWPAVEQNHSVLTESALAWLRGLPVHLETRVGGVSLGMVHGTPAEPLEGRWYPDREPAGEAWLPKSGAVLVLGHTHYPLIRALPGGGLLLNPGSVGQPRDGDPRPSWILFDTERRQALLMRTEYDRSSAMRELRGMAWNERSVQALAKKVGGALQVDNAGFPE